MQKKSTEIVARAAEGDAVYGSYSKGYWMVRLGGTRPACPGASAEGGCGGCGACTSSSVLAALLLLRCVYLVCVARTQLELLGARQSAVSPNCWLLGGGE